MAKTPKDELELAAMVAAAKANGLHLTAIAPFETTGSGIVVGCCALGARQLAGLPVDGNTMKTRNTHKEIALYLGSDGFDEESIPSDRVNNWYTLGCAFREAMT